MPQRAPWATAESILDERMEDIVVLFQGAQQIGQGMRSEWARTLQAYAQIRRDGQAKRREQASQQLNEAREQATEAYRLQQAEERQEQRREQAADRVRQASASQTDANLRDSMRNDWWDKHTLAEIARVDASARKHAPDNEHIAQQYAVFSRRFRDMEQAKLKGDLDAAKRPEYWQQVDRHDVARTIGYIEKHKDSKEIARRAPGYYQQAHERFGIPIAAFALAEAGSETVAKLDDAQIERIAPDPSGPQAEQVRETVATAEQAKADKLDVPVWNDPATIANIRNSRLFAQSGLGDTLVAKWEEENRQFEEFAREHPDEARAWLAEQGKKGPQWLVQGTEPPAQPETATAAGGRREVETVQGEPAVSETGTPAPAQASEPAPPEAHPGIAALAASGDREAAQSMEIGNMSFQSSAADALAKLAERPATAAPAQWPTPPAPQIPLGPQGPRL